jgi:hypothetical protein
MSKWSGLRATRRRSGVQRCVTDRIIHIAERLVSVYEDLLDSAAWLRSIPVTEESARRALGVLAMYVDQPIGAMRSFVSNYVAEADTFIDRLERKEKIFAQMTITFDVPREISKEFDKALAAVEREVRRRRRWGIK